MVIPSSSTVGLVDFPMIVDFPIKHGAFPCSYVNVYQRVIPTFGAPSLTICGMIQPVTTAVAWIIPGLMADATTGSKHLSGREKHAVMKPSKSKSYIISN